MIKHIKLSSQSLSLAHANMENICLHMSNLWHIAEGAAAAFIAYGFVIAAQALDEQTLALISGIVGAAMLAFATVRDKRIVMLKSDLADEREDKQGLWKRIGTLETDLARAVERNVLLEQEMQKHREEWARRANEN